ncbi:MAG: hypothetical protein WCA82_03615 [Jiangellales bacterium]
MDAYTRTRVSLHAVAEGVLAGPQHERSSTIRLRALQGGFATVAEPSLRVAGTEVVTAAGDRVALTGTFADVAVAAGVIYTVPALYGDHAPVGPTDEVVVDAVSAARIASWFDRGRQALLAVAPAQTPVLWPEHFDLAVTVEQVNLGVSPGDGYHAEPYAYVGPWDYDASLPGYAAATMFNAPFGAVRSMQECPDVDSMVRFFAAGRSAVARARRAAETT